MTYTQVWDAMQNQISETMVLRDEDQAYIPFDDGNRDYQEYKQWLSAGNRPTPASAPTPPPTGGVATKKGTK
jgi:hypothetical protein